MSDRRAPRLIVEVAFLVALSAALAFAGLETYEVVGVILLGWALVALFEWGALRGRAHYGSGSPPRWYVPRVTLPPPRPLEQVSAGYPAAEPASDAPTWIASPAMLAEWPVAEADTDADSNGAVEEQTQVHDVDVDVALAIAEQVEEAPPPELDEPARRAEPEAIEPAPAPVRPPAGARTRPSAPRRETVARRTARHRIDPLAPDPARGRRFGRRAGVVAGDVDVPDGPPRERWLPMQAGSED
jgi:hypothetical protein